MIREEYYWNWYTYENMQHLCRRASIITTETTACNKEFPVSLLINDDLPYCPECSRVVLLQELGE